MADTKTMKLKIQLRNDTVANWAKSDPVLLKGEAALGRLDGALSNYYQLRIGVDGKKWSELEPSNIMIPAANVSGLTGVIDETETNTVYTLSSVALNEGETGNSFQLFSHEKGETEWKAVDGSRFNVPAFDPSELEASIKTLSGDLSTVSSDLDTLESDFTTLTATTLPKVSADTLTAANAYADQAEADALTAAKAYTNAVSAELSTATKSQIDDINKKLANGVHFVGTVTETKFEGGKGYYKLAPDGEWKEAQNGDIVVVNSKEYILSEAGAKWEEFGDEGNYATKTYVDTAKAEAINATTNKVSEVSNASELPAANNIKGDIGIVKAQIGSTDKYEYTGYVWNGTQWMQMDGNYSADKVIMPENMTITYQFGKYTIPSSGSKTLDCAGKTLKEFLNDAFAEVKSGTVSKPAFSLTAGGDKTAEIGTTYKLPAATFKMTSAGSYQYGPATGITVPVGSAEVSCTTAGFTTQTANTTAMAANSSIATAAGTADITYLSTAVTYSFGAHADYTEGATPKNNIGGDDPSKKIAAGTSTATCTAKYTGVYPAYYGFTSSPKATPTAITAANGNVTVDGITYTRELNSFSKTSFTASSKWYELFYMVPAGKHSKWTGKDSNNVDLAVDTKGSATVTFLDGSTATYDVFVVRNAAQYSATTCTMKWA